MRQIHVRFGEGLRLEVEHAAHIGHVLTSLLLSAARGGLGNLGTEDLPLLREAFVDGVVLAGVSHDCCTRLDEAHTGGQAGSCVRDAGLVPGTDPLVEPDNVGDDGRYLVFQELDVALLKLVSRPFLLFYRESLLLLLSVRLHLLIN